MPTPFTYEIPAVNSLIAKHHRVISADPFSGRSEAATYRNDLNPETPAEYHMDALEFLNMLLREEICLHTVLFDPPYSLRQCCEVYKSAGKPVTTRDTQIFGRWTEHKLVISKLVNLGGKVLSFGWNSQGMGIKNGFEIEEILLICHGGAHNDTICTVERKVQGVLL